MLNKIMKAALAASLVFGMSSFAYAADGKVGGSFKEYFGQYNSGAAGYEANFRNYGEANLTFKGTAGKASVFFEIQADTSSNLNASEVSDVQRKVSYATPIGLVSIGTIVNIGTIPMAGSGYKTSKVPSATRRGLLVAGYTEDDGIDLVVPLEGMGFVQATVYSKAGTAVSAGAAGDEGQIIQLGANLNFSGIGVRLGYSAEKVDDPTVTTDGDNKTSAMLLGAKVPLGSTMAIAFDYTSAKVTKAAVDTDHNTTDFTFEMGGVGPGKLYVGYDMWTIKDTIKYANLSLVYDVSNGEGGGFQFGYSSNGKTPEGGSTTTETVLLGGIYAAF